ncbi:hypothetical protein ACB092_05G084700 [Castanea dentata]
MKFLYDEENYKYHDNSLTKFKKMLYGEKYLERRKKWITMYYGESYNAKTEIEERLAKLRKSRGDKDKLFNRLSKFGIYDGTTELGLKSVGRIYHLVDKKKSLGEAKEEIRKAMLGLDNIEMGSKVDHNSTKLEINADAVLKMLPYVLRLLEDMMYFRQYGCPHGGNSK